VGGGKKGKKNGEGFTKSPLVWGDGAPAESIRQEGVTRQGTFYCYQTAVGVGLGVVGGGRLEKKRVMPTKPTRKE